MHTKWGFQRALSGWLMVLLMLVAPAAARAQEGGSEGDEKPKKQTAEEKKADKKAAAEEKKGDDNEPSPEKPADKAPTVEELQRRLQEQLKQLETQSKQLEDQRKLIEQQGQSIDDQRKLLAAMQTQLDQIAQQPAEPTEESVALKERLEKLEDRVNESPEDPITAGDFPGSINIPGTNAAMKLGGFVKMSVVNTFDPLGSDDRFVVASIPVDEDTSGEGSRSSLSAQASRINIDLREASTKGNLRAFVEFDFAEGDDQARLRHAFGQFRTVLAGQTWSTLVDGQALPEEIDFEGLSGRIRLRQTQIRWMPKLGERLRLQVAMEDPAPDVTNGDGISQIPDFMSSIRWRRGNRHVQLAVLLRQIRAQPEDSGSTDSEFGWGVSWSGKLKVTPKNDRHHLLFQLNVGDGIGRYINDLGEEGGQDAVINPATGRMKTLKAAGMYIAYNHWWTERFRSTWVYSKVYVDNLDIQQDNAYKTTDRLTANVMFSPIPRLDLGMEILWGRKEVKDGDSETATQIQFAAIYRF